MATRATHAELLEQRIAENAASQEIDLATWIFDRAQVRPDDRVLELCCGTGGQTLRFLERLGKSGHVVALDTSKEALGALAGKVDASLAAKLTLIEGNIDSFSETLQKAELVPNTFDTVFCAYGLYYSADAKATLTAAQSWLKRDGRIVVVGPFGPNNGALFDLVRASGVTIPSPVIDSSEHFMLRTVVPWASRNYASTSIHTMVNRVRWASPERVLNYWQNTTFYDPQRRSAFEFLLHQHFERNEEFVNEKWVMMVEMKDARG